MAVTATQLNQIYFAYFGRPPDLDGYNFYLNNAASTAASVAAAFSASPESQALYGTTFGAAQVNAIYQNLFNRDAELAGLTYWSAEVNAGRLTAAGAALGILQGAQNADKTSVDNKLAISVAFFAALDTASEIVGYTGTAAAGSARAFLKTVSSDPATVSSANANLSAQVALAVAQGTSAPGAGGGTTSVFTTTTDLLTGTSGNDIFIGEGSTVTVADQVNGGNGVDTLRLFSTVVLPQLTSIESIYINGNTAGLDISTRAGVTMLEVDSQTAGFTYTVTQGQSVKLTNTSSVTTTIAGTASQTVLDLSLNRAGGTVDVSGTGVATLNLSASTNPSAFALSNTGGALATLSVSGDKMLNVSSAIAGLKTVNASGGSGGFWFDASSLASDNNLTFTGGLGNDKVTFKAGFLTVNDVLDGGAGVDVLAVNDTAIATAAVNAAKNFEVLQLNTTGGTVDNSALTSVNSFATGAGNISATFNNSLSSTTYSIDNSSSNSGTVAINNKVSETTANVTVTTDTSTSAGTLAALQISGANTVNLVSTGAGANVITSLKSADNTLIKVSGTAALTLTLQNTTAIGSTVDATGFALKLTATGTSFNDVFVGGSAGDALTGGQGSDTLTGGGGADTFIFSATAGATTSGAAFGGADTITDFVVGADKLQFTGVTEVVSAELAAVQAAVGALAVGSTTAQIAAAMAVTSTTNLGVSFATFGGSTYVLFETTGGGTGVAANDVFIKLTGVTTATFAADVIA